MPSGLKNEEAGIATEGVTADDGPTGIEQEKVEDSTPPNTPAANRSSGLRRRASFGLDIAATNAPPNPRRQASAPAVQRQSTLGRLRRGIDRAQSIGALVAEHSDPTNLANRLTNALHARFGAPASEAPRKPRGAERLRRATRGILGALRMREGKAVAAMQEEEEEEEENDEYLGYLGREVELVRLGGYAAKLNGLRGRAVRWDAESQRMAVTVSVELAVAEDGPRLTRTDEDDARLEAGSPGLALFRLANLKLDDEDSTEAWAVEADKLRWRSLILETIDIPAQTLLSLAARYPAELCVLRACAATEADRSDAGRAAAVEAARKMRQSATRHEAAADRMQPQYMAACSKYDNGNNLIYRDECFRLSGLFFASTEAAKRARAAAEYHDSAEQAQKARRTALHHHSLLPSTSSAGAIAGAVGGAPRTRSLSAGVGHVRRGWRGAYFGFLPALTSSIVGASLRHALPSLAKAMLGRPASAPTPFWLALVASVVAAIPQLALDRRWAQGSLLTILGRGSRGGGEDGTGEAAGGHGERSSSRISSNVATFIFGHTPLWLVASRAFADPLMRPWDLLRRLLPTSHVLHESRSLMDSLAATPRLTLIAVGLPYYLMPLPDLPLSVCFRRALLAWSTALPAALLGRGVRGLAAYAYGKLRRECLEPRILGTTLRTHAQRLKRAEERAQSTGVAVVDMSMLQRVALHQPRIDSGGGGGGGGSGGGGGPPGYRPPMTLGRQSSMKAKLAAKDALEPKRRRLLKRAGVSIVYRPPRSVGRGVPILFVQRDDLLSTLRRLGSLPTPQLREGSVVVAFGTNWHDTSTWEVAEDAGGPFRELYSIMADYLKGEATSSRHAKDDEATSYLKGEEATAGCPLLSATEDGSLLPAPSATATERPVQALRGLGRLLALSILRSTPLNVSFSRCLYKVLLHEPITPEDVRRVDPDFAEHRVASLLRDGGVAAMEAALMDDLTFVGAAREGEEEGEELIPGGASVRVTEDTKHFFCALLVEHYLVGGCP